MSPAPSHSRFPRRLALVTTELREGGAEKCLTELALRVDRARYEPRVFVLQSPPAAPRDRLYERLRAAGIPVQFLGLQRAWQLPRAARKMRLAWRAWPPHIVQAFLFHADVLSAHVAPRLHIPVVNLGLRVAEPARWRQRLERWASRRARRVVCVSGSVAHAACERWGIAEEKIEVIRNGVDVSRFDQAESFDWRELGWEPESRVLLTVGRLEPQKGIERIIEPFAELVRRNPSVKLAIVGEGSQRSDLESLVGSHGLQESIRLLGWRNDVPSLLKGAAGLLLPSRYEGMPNAVLDAMAAGRPVAAFDVAGIGELLAHTGNPWARQGDVRGLMEIAERIVREPDWAQQVGQRCAWAARENYSLEAMVRAYERMFEEELAELAGS